MAKEEKININKQIRTWQGQVLTSKIADRTLIKHILDAKEIKTMVTWMPVFKCL